MCLCVLFLLLIQEWYLYNFIYFCNGGSPEVEGGWFLPWFCLILKKAYTLDGQLWWKIRKILWGICIVFWFFILLLKESNRQDQKSVRQLMFDLNSVKLPMAEELRHWESVQFHFMLIHRLKLDVLWQCIESLWQHINYLMTATVFLVKRLK